jgi:hypothetical protein
VTGELVAMLTHPIALGLYALWAGVFAYCRYAERRSETVERRTK